MSNPQKISSKTVNNIQSYPANKQADRQTNGQTATRLLPSSVNTIHF